MKKLLIIILSLMVLLPSISFASTTLDYYAPSNQSDESSLGTAGVGNHYGWGQSFTTPNDGNSYKLTSLRWQMRRNGTPTGNLSAYAKIYAHTGAYGSGKPTGDALATSDAFDVSTLTESFPTTESTITLFSFSGANQITLTPNTYYVVSIEYSGSTASSVVAGCDNTTPSHGGNDSYKSVTDALWYAFTRDMIFYVYGDALPPVTTPTMQIIWWMSD